MRRGFRWWHHTRCRTRLVPSGRQLSGRRAMLPAPVRWCPAWRDTAGAPSQLPSHIGSAGHRLRPTADQTPDCREWVKASRQRTSTIQRTSSGPFLSNNWSGFHCRCSRTFAPASSRYCMYLNGCAKGRSRIADAPRDDAWDIRRALLLHRQRSGKGCLGVAPPESERRRNSFRDCLGRLGSTANHLFHRGSDQSTCRRQIGR